MHEIGIAQNIIEVVEEEARKNNSKNIKKVKLLIGEFTGIVKESLEFAFEILKKGSLAKDADFEIEAKELKTFCESCEKSFINSNGYNFICSQCGNSLEIVEGREMEIQFIDIE